MKIRVKLYAGLDKYLPDGAEKNEADMEVGEGTRVTELIERLRLPLEYCHLVLVNGAYLAPGERADAALKEGDALAIWPPVAGGRDD